MRRRRKKNRFSLTVLALFLAVLCIGALFNEASNSSNSQNYVPARTQTASAENSGVPATETPSAAPQRQNSHFAFPSRLRVGTYNLHNFHDRDRVSRDGKYRTKHPKPDKEKEALYRTILTVRPDVLAVQEIGGNAYLEEMAQALAARGLEFPYRELLVAYDRYNRVAILSRVPFSKTIKLEVRRKLMRGLLGIGIPVADGQIFYVYTTHLKSKISNDPDDPEAGEKRGREAVLIRRLIEFDVRDEKTAEKIPANRNIGVPANLKKNEAPALFALMGDFNDNPGTPALAPLEASTFATALPAKASDGGNVTFVNARYNYYNTFDRIFVSPTVYKKFYVPLSAKIADFPWAGTASDHRLVYADFDFSPKN